MVESGSAFRTVATMCVPPGDYASLGDDGVMLIDSANSLIPPLDG